MSVLGAQERAKRRRVEASLLAGLMLAVTVAGAMGCAWLVLRAFADVGVLFSGYR